MSWSELTLTVPNALKDAIVGELSELGASGVWESGEPDADHTQLAAYFAAEADFERIRESLCPLFERMDLIPPDLQVRAVEDRDWGEAWKKSWTSFPLGRRFFVIPSWSDSACPPDRFPITLDPGQAFGTGTHETTQLTLKAMEVWLEPRHIVLDVGTGSGILAIAAALLDAKAVHACDNDPVAVEVARENLEGNGARAGLYCGSVDAIADGVVSFLLCNLTADAIAEVLSDIYRVLRPQGLAVFSGILNSQRAEVRERADLFGFTILESTTQGEWCALVVRKHGR